jgi:hypothetical protein
MKLPFSGRILKSISVRQSNYYKKKLYKSINTLTKYKRNLTQINVTLVSFSGQSQLLDQCLSISSFLQSLGIPRKWYIYSDGTHNAESLNTLQLFDFVEVINIADTKKTWQENKFNLFIQHPIVGTTFFLDSDILFFPFFNNFFNKIKQYNWVFPENFGSVSLDDEYDSTFSPFLTSINTGFIIINEKIDWTLGKEYLQEKISRNDLTYFMEQSAMNKVFEVSNKTKTLDPRYFLLTTSDHFTIKLHENDELALRHYVGPIRHKMYISFKKHFC